jgi:Na+/proline symporter
MILQSIDWVIILLFFFISMLIGLLASKQSGKNTSEFFLSGRNMPWWLLGVSMVATTFSADTPNLVTDIVRKNGVSGNWVWWAFLLTGMLTVFVFSKLWRRSQVLTDLEFYEIRYSGKPAAFLRGFRAIYLGFFFNVLIMASVSLAAIKLGGIMLILSPVQTILIAGSITVLYSAIGGLRAVIFTDFFQFLVAMAGGIWAAFVAVQHPSIGSLTALFSNPNVASKLSLLPDFNDSTVLIPVLIIPIAVQWWSVWYPGAEPGGGGYIAQRMLSAKNEKNALAATLFFNIAHYALRPWPWIIVALASIVVFPDVQSLKTAFPNIPESYIQDDIAYPAMLTFLPSGVIGLVVASLISAFMSTISTHLNWGSSYLVNDFYKRFIKPEATEKELVNAGRLSIVMMMMISAILALYLNNALQAFNILLQIGAGTGLIFILRWFWYRINAYTEITGMIVSFLVAIYFEIIHTALGFEALPDHYKLILSVGITGICWLTVTLLTQPSDNQTLIRFYNLVKPASPGWKKVISDHQLHEEPGQLPLEILGMVIGCITVYSFLFSSGFLLYKNYLPGFILAFISAIGFVVIFKIIKKIKFM